MNASPAVLKSNSGYMVFTCAQVDKNEEYAISVGYSNGADMVGSTEDTLVIQKLYINDMSTSWIKYYMNTDASVT